MSTEKDTEKNSITDHIHRRLRGPYRVRGSLRMISFRISEKTLEYFTCVSQKKGYNRTEVLESFMEAYIQENQALLYKCEEIQQRLEQEGV